MRESRYQIDVRISQPAGQDPFVARVIIESLTDKMSVADAAWILWHNHQQLLGQPTMGQFNAIEARATQYPASTNDVVWLVGRIRVLRTALELAKEDMIAAASDGQDPVSRGLRRRIETITTALEALEEPNLPVD